MEQVLEQPAEKKLDFAVSSDISHQSPGRRRKLARVANSVANRERAGGLLFGRLFDLDFLRDA